MSIILTLGLILKQEFLLTWYFGCRVHIDIWIFVAKHMGTANQLCVFPRKSSAFSFSLQLMNKSINKYLLGSLYLEWHWIKKFWLCNSKFWWRKKNLQYSTYHWEDQWKHWVMIISALNYYLLEFALKYWFSLRQCSEFEEHWMTLWMQWKVLLAGGHDGHLVDPQLWECDVALYRNTQVVLDTAAKMSHCVLNSFFMLKSIKTVNHSFSSS